MHDPGQKIAVSLEYFFRVDLLILRIIGLPSFASVFSTDELRSSWWECCYFVIGVSLIISVVLAEAATIFCAQNELNYIIEVVASIGSIILCTVKGIRLWTHRHLLHNLLRQISILWDSASTHNCLTAKIMKDANNTTTMRKIYITSIAALALSYSIRPCIMFIQHQTNQQVDNSFDYTVTVFPTTYPFTIESLQGYLVFTTYQQITAIIACLYWVSSDTLFAQFMTHISIQFTILANSLEYIDAIGNVHEYEDIVERKLKHIAKQHNQLFTFCCTMETYFNPIIFLTVLSNGINLCCCLYRMDQQLAARDWNEVAKNISHLTSLMMQTVIYCGYAETLTRNSVQVCFAAYKSEWIRFNKKSKAILMIIMMRAAKEYNFTVYGMISLNLTRVTMIVNGAVSYFMLLKNVS